VPERFANLNTCQRYEDRIDDEKKIIQPQAEGGVCFGLGIPGSQYLPGGGCIFCQFKGHNPSGRNRCSQGDIKDSQCDQKDKAQNKGDNHRPFSSGI
jgi:hypothetical protein